MTVSELDAGPAPRTRLNQRAIAKRSNWLVRHRRGRTVAWSRLHARLYRLTRGRFFPRWFAGAPVMVLEVRGRRSGDLRAAPILYLRDGDALIVCASNAGAHRTPAWWLNLREAGEGTAIIGGQRTQVRPRVLAGAERERLWQAFAEMYPQVEMYTEFTERPFPLVALEPTVSESQDRSAGS
jgi:deazaflavin-dependent oxidoreductase (nitroreductase family)